MPERGPRAVQPRGCGSVLPCGNPCPTHQGYQRGHFAKSPCLLLATSSDRGKAPRIQTIRSWVCNPNCRLNAWMFGCLGGALPPKCFLAMHVGWRIYIRNISNIYYIYFKMYIIKIWIYQCCHGTKWSVWHITGFSCSLNIPPWIYYYQTVDGCWYIS